MYVSLGAFFSIVDYVISGRIKEHRTKIMYLWSFFKAFGCLGHQVHERTVKNEVSWTCSVWFCFVQSLLPVNIKITDFDSAKLMLLDCVCHTQTFCWVYFVMLVDSALNNSDNSMLGFYRSETSQFSWWFTLFLLLACFTLRWYCEEKIE